MSGLQTRSLAPGRGREREEPNLWGAWLELRLGELPAGEAAGGGGQGLPVTPGTEGTLHPKAEQQPGSPQT